MLTITKLFTFDSAHFLPEHQGKCQNVHGHTYKLAVTIEGPPQHEGPAKGMLMDFGDLSQIVNQKVVNPLDHKTLNAIVHNPTAENLVAWIVSELKGSFNGGQMDTRCRLVKIKLWETPTSYCEWSALG